VQAGVPRRQLRHREGDAERLRRLLGSGLLDFGPKRLAQKAKYGGELFLAHGLADPRTGRRYREFFQHDRSGNPKGVIVLDLGDLP
jgi:hypothetical protein